MVDVISGQKRKDFFGNMQNQHKYAEKGRF
jgi:hypothetical protein